MSKFADRLLQLRQEANLTQSAGETSLRSQAGADKKKGGKTMNIVNLTKG